MTPGASRGDQVSILKGLAPNDVVVTAGQLKLHNNAAVKIDNTLQPTDNRAPVPQDQWCASRDPGTRSSMTREQPPALQQRPNQPL